MEYTFEKLSGNKAKVSFKVTADEFEAAVHKAFLAQRGRITIPGFRTGKAPRFMIESLYGKDVFFSDALENLFNETYPKAIEENKILPVAQPELDVPKINAGEDFTFSCEVFVFPDVVLGEYKGVPVARKFHTVTDAEIDSRIEQERKRVARSIEVTDRALENGDKAELDYSGSVDGEKFDGGTAEKQTLVIGSNSFIPGFEEQMIGMMTGEERDLNVRFPDEYHAENLKGKDAVFHVKLHTITREELPAVDDDFAAEVSDFNTLDEYRADLRKTMQASEEEKADENAKTAMLETIVDNAECDVPDPMVEDKLDEMMRQMDARMHQQGFSMEQYLQILNQTEDQLREMYRHEALSQVKSEIVIDKIIEKEDVKAEDADVDALLQGYAEPMGQSVEQIKAGFNEGQLEYFKHRAQIKKLMDTLWNEAAVTSEEAKEEAPKTENGEEAEK